MINFLLTHSPLLYFTQSLWRDEAFSILVAKRPLMEVLPKLTFEPPVYYILLHYWIKIFGTSEIAVRSLSLLGFSLATIVVIVWAEKLFRNHWLSWFLPLFFFLNPMLLYYAFEIRTYGWFMLFATWSFFTYQTKQWPLYIIATTLGFYTHTYMIFVPFTQAVHYLLTNRQLWNRHNLKHFFKDPMVRSCVVIGALMSPWFFKISLELAKLKSSWYFPVDFHLIQSVLGNLFIGYEGTPWYLWPFTALLSLILLGLFVLAMYRPHTRKQNLFFFLQVFVPLTVVIGISFIKPLYVNRYLIPVAIAEVFLVALAIETIRHALAQKVAAIAALAFVVGVDIWYPSQHPKLPIRDTFAQINALRGANDVVFAKSSLIFFESIYYSSDPSRVFLYNPNNSPFPWYVGDIIVSKNQMANDLPMYPIRAFLVSADGSFSVAYQTQSPIAHTTGKK